MEIRFVPGRVTYPYDSWSECWPHDPLTMQQINILVDNEPTGHIDWSVGRLLRDTERDMNHGWWASFPIVPTKEPPGFKSLIPMSSYPSHWEYLDDAKKAVQEAVRRYFEAA